MIYLGDNEVYRLIWKNYAELKTQYKIPRSGAGLYGVYPYDPKGVVDWLSRYESVAEHVSGTMILASQIAMYLPEVISKERLLDYMMLLQHHELAENVTGDIPNDGRRDEKAKDRRELTIIQQYCKSLPKEWQKLQLWFLEFQTKSTEFGQNCYLIDKFEALLQGLIFEQEGRPGDLKNKPEGQISEDDKHYAEKTSSTLLVDVWSAHVFDAIGNYKHFPHFVGILRAVVEDVRGKWFDWAT